MEIDMSIQLKNVSYSYRGKYQTVRAVDNVSYDFESGKIYAIIGKSGSGKTTLLSLMAGLDLPSEGEILVDGRSTREWNRNTMRRDAISVIYQNYNLFPMLTVSENIQYPLTLKKVPKKESEEIAKRMRERVELVEAYDNRLPAHLSGGEQQRVAIARCLAQGSKIILADEPTGNLDSKNTQNVVEILRDLAHRDGATVIIVTHDSAVADKADVVLKMRDGAWSED
ncbi:MAG: ABC transporter ATP-binding protein [Clostridia bacterium]|nr:ABC transporter ATP-binding protein [Clostridia bacterium]